MPYTTAESPRVNSFIHKSLPLNSTKGQLIRVKISTPYVFKIYINVFSYILISSRWCLSFILLYIAFLCIYLLQHLWSNSAHFNLSDFFFLMLLCDCIIFCEIYLTPCLSQYYSFSEWDAGILRIREKCCWKVMENDLFLNFTIMTMKPTSLGQSFKNEDFFKP